MDRHATAVNPSHPYCVGETDPPSRASSSSFRAAEEIETEG
jgi:hypothetical protein